MERTGSSAPLAVALWVVAAVSGGCTDLEPPSDAGPLDAALVRPPRDTGPPSCDALTHTGCVGLCCEGGCVPISLLECTACGVGCPPDGADACLGRSCRCGQGPACTGGTPFCYGGQCVECRTHDDCPVGTCREGRCHWLGDARPLPRPTAPVLG